MRASGSSARMPRAICSRSMVLPALGGETIKPRVPRPIGATRSTTRMLGRPRRRGETARTGQRRPVGQTACVFETLPATGRRPTRPRPARALAGRPRRPVTARLRRGCARASAAPGPRPRPDAPGQSQHAAVLGALENAADCIRHGVSPAVRGQAALRRTLSTAILVE